jgi:hypothetical protein
LGALHDLYDRFCERIAFFIVYIKEAHPEGGWVITHNRREDIRVLDPTTMSERAAVASQCVVRTAVRIPVLVDGPGNEVAKAYGAWPDRLYLIGRDGRIVFQGEPGPFGFAPDRLEEAIALEIGAAGERRPSATSETH